MGDQLQPDATWEFVSKVERHVCNLPREQGVAADFKVGDIIKCKECSRQYILDEIDGGMQHDPITPPVLRWKHMGGPQFQ